MFKVLKSATSLPQPVRRKSRILVNIAEWKKLERRLRGEGLKPYETAAVIFSPDQVKELNIRTLPKIFSKMTKDLINELDAPYDVSHYETDHKAQVIVIAHRPLSKGELRKAGAGSVKRTKVPVNGRRKKHSRFLTRKTA